MSTGPAPRLYRDLPLDRGELAFGWMRRFHHDVLGGIDELVHRHGPLVRFRMGPRELLLVGAPDPARDVMVTHHDAWIKLPAVYDLARIILGEGLIHASGPTWKRKRRMVQPAFHRQKIRGFAASMQARADELAGIWNAALVEGRPVDVERAMRTVTLQIIGDTMFGSDLDTHALVDAAPVLLEQINNLVDSIIPGARYLPTPGNLRMYRARRQLRGAVEAIIRARRERDHAGDDLLGMLISAVDDDSGRMEEDELVDECLTIISAGHETTAAAMTWAMYELSRRPELVERLREACGDEPDLVTPGAVPLLDAVIREVLRRYPPVWGVGRQSTRAVQVGDVVVPPGVGVVVAIHHIQHDPQHWDEPARFRPERFLDQDVPEHAWMPFIHGPRMCIGKGFALLEMRILLATLVRRVDLSPCEDVGRHAGITLWPDRPVVLGASRATSQAGA